jgi:two-component system, LuxR family, response regulator FixJ
VKEGEVTVFLVDDDLSVRTVMQRMLQEAAYTVESHGDGASFLAAWTPDRPGCLVLDLDMPGMNGLQVQAALNERGSILPIIFLTGHADVPRTVQALKSGAAEFLEKPVRNDTLLGYVAQAIERDRQRRRSLEERRVVLARYARLTPREREVLELMAQGAANKVIADDLHISQRTVEVHRARLMRKMRTHSVAQLIQMAMLAEVIGRPH